MKEFFDSSALLDDQEALRGRFEQDGYVYLPGLLDTQPLMELRRQIVEICSDCNWLKRGTDPMDAISWTVPKVEGEDEYFEVYDRVQRLQNFHAIPHQPVLMDVMRALLGETAFPHPLSIARLVFPDNQDWSTPPHQDYFNNQGTKALYAAWMPLSDCPQSMGPLAVLEGSHKLGPLPMEYAHAAGFRQTSESEKSEPLSWVSKDFRMGDVVIFHSLTVHKALHNQSDRMRLSVDYRYQAEGEDMSDACFQNHFNRQDWASIYKDWSSDELKYYWRDKDINVVPWDTELANLPEDHMATALRLERVYDRHRKSLADKYSTQDNQNREDAVTNN